MFRMLKLLLRFILGAKLVWIFVYENHCICGDDREGTTDEFINEFRCS